MFSTNVFDKAIVLKCFKPQCHPTKFSSSLSWQKTSSADALLNEWGESTHGIL